MSAWEVRQGHVIDVLRELAAESVQCIVTSPPYWGLRDYGLEPLVWGGPDGCKHEWERKTHRVVGGQNDVSSSTVTGGRGKRDPLNEGVTQSSDCFRCNAWRGSLGLEPTPDLYVEHLVEVFREVKRVLRKDGTLWLNLGDSYASGGTGGASDKSTLKNDGRRLIGARNYEQRLNESTRARPAPPGLKPKDLVGMPWRVAFALQQDGWWLRSEIIWSKPNPMPESVTDRPTRAHEQVFLLTKSKSYFYDADAVREPHTDSNSSRDAAQRHYGTTASGEHVPGAALDGSPYVGQQKHRGLPGVGTTFAGWNPAGRNLRSVWTIPTEPFPEAHFATFPKKLVEPCVKAGTSEKGCCPECGVPWERVVETLDNGRGRRSYSPSDTRAIGQPQRSGPGSGALSVHTRTLGWQPSCSHSLDPIPQLVLDPFCGSGTVGVVARGFGRSFIGVELSETYADMARRRISGTKRGLDEDGTPLWEQESMFS